jgi:hypothetical protein
MNLGYSSVRSRANAVSLARPYVTVPAFAVFESPLFVHLTYALQPGEQR